MKIMEAAEHVVALQEGAEEVMERVDGQRCCIERVEAIPADRLWRRDDSLLVLRSCSDTPS